ncbi:MAG: DUF6597 domain-containing transcriptional factor [Pseudomonadota bacterium]|nr:DUF6597 domain-containing transcriptional factor [Pseudomonadota bacterium]
MRRPAAGLARFVAQYWLSLDNSAPLYTALPDGCVDLVFEVSADHCRSWVYGSTTRSTAIACLPGIHYLAIRFLPGQSRHFITSAANELTDCRQDSRMLLQFPAEQIAARIAAATLFDELDVVEQIEPAAGFWDPYLT